MTGPSSDRRADADRARQSDRDLPEIDAAALFNGRREVIIHHKGEQYRLRLTQSGKLILTK